MIFCLLALSMFDQGKANREGEGGTSDGGEILCEH